ncbi:MAG: ribosome biogenesis GTPase Der [Candidatus Gracilibacteria bacterium]|nr:ribosome biogenesis GTPase Der [Candidatus Gracilibacteria bacterium]
MLGKITIIGRPNVGKSSFFNMYTGHKIAIVDDTAGTTRDISEYEFDDVEHELTYILADSGGLDFGSKDDSVAEDIIDRTDRAIDESDLLIWLIEYDNFTDLDEKILKLLKKKNYNNYLLVANKADNETKVMESYSLAGKGELEFFPVSVSHNKGISDIKKYVAKYLKGKGLNYKQEDFDDSFVKLAMIGRPNVGKSSMINAIVGKDRVMVKDMPGTTRDSIDTKFSFEGTNFVLIDTAGIRRLSKVGTRNVENWSVMRSERALKRADIVAVVIDGYEGIVQQDLSIINTALEEKKGLIIVVNKWDKVLAKPGVDKEHMMNRYIAYLQEKMDFLPWVSVIFTSALDKKRVNEILERAKEIKEERYKRVKTSILNNFLEQAIYKHPPTGNKKSHTPKIYYGTQADTNPPKFVFTVSNPDHFHFSYKRYLENRIRDNFGFEGTPIIIEYRGRGKNAGKVK